MTDFASLAIEIDSRQAGDAARDLDKLTAAGERTEKATKGFQGEWVRASSEAGRLRMGLIGAEVQMNKVTASAGAQRAGMQSLSYQIGDVAQQFALGTNPMIIFAQQGGQVVQALSMMQGGASGLVGFLAGPWGAVIMGAATIAGMFASKLFESGDAAAKAAKQYDNAAQAARGLVGAMNAMKLNEKQMELNKLVENRMRLENMLSGPRAAGGAVIDPDGGPFGTRRTRYAPAVEQELRAIKLQEAAARSLIGVAERENAARDATAKAHDAAKEARKRHTAETKAAAEARRAAAQATREMEQAQRRAIAIEESYQRAIYGSNRALAERMDRYAALDPLAGKFGFEQAKPLTVAEQIAGEVEKFKGPLDDAAASQARWNDEIDASLSRLSRLGGVGSDIAGIFGALRGDFSAVGGRTGAVMQSVLGLTTGATIKDRNGLDVAETLGNRLENIFKKDGAFGKTMGSLLQGAGTGISMAQTIFGTNASSGTQIGGAIGGALGKVAGEAVGKAIGGTMGKLAGPIGAIAGSLLGGLIGGLFGKKPSGTGTITNTSVTSQANDAGIKGSIDSFGLGTQTAINQIAEQLGGNVGKYSVGVGRYKDFYQVSSRANDPLLGRAHYERDSAYDVYDGLDAQAALRAAIAEAIRQGAIEGVRAGTQTLLKAGTDIEAQLRKALQFEGVFKDLKQATDPIGFALDEVTKQFDRLRKVFTEAKATTAEFADLEKLLAIKRADAVEQARRDMVSKVSDPINLQIRILELLGKSEEALTATRLLELAGLKDSLQPMQAMVYQLEDAKKVIDTFQPLADSLKKYRAELLGESDTNGSFGYLTAQFRQTALSAANGDATAMGALQGAASAYLDAAKNNARSEQEYQRARAEVLASVDKGIFAADAQIDYAQAQIDATANVAAILADMKVNMASIGSNLVQTNAEVLRLWKRIDSDGFANPLPVEVTTP